MKNGQNQRRSRGRNSGKNQGRKNDNNRNDQRMRGNAPQLLEKYKGLARDALASGDRILAENYFQYADHYQRLVNERDAQRAARQEEREQQRQAEEAARDNEADSVSANGAAPDHVDEAEEEQVKQRPSRSRRAKTAEDSERSEQEGGSALVVSSDNDSDETPVETPKRRTRRARKAPEPADVGEMEDSVPPSDGTEAEAAAAE